MKVWASVSVRVRFMGPERVPPTWPVRFTEVGETLKVTCKPLFQ